MRIKMFAINRNTGRRIVSQMFVTIEEGTCPVAVQLDGDGSPYLHADTHAYEKVADADDIEETVWFFDESHEMCEEDDIEFVDTLPV